MMKIENPEIGGRIVPKQKTGTQMHAEEKVVCKSAVKALNFYQLVKKRLLDVNGWSEMAAVSMSSFKLFDFAGRAVNRPAAEGDFIRIDIPGPGIKTGGGYDWVIIEAIDEEFSDDTEVISIRVRPAAHPLGDDEHTAHFLKRCATSTFQVKRTGKVIMAEEHGRNEVPNLETGHLTDNIRNAIVGMAAKIGFSYPQWKSLVTGLLSEA